jgi:sulfonate transport system substrate-binding protein
MAQRLQGSKGSNKMTQRVRYFIIGILGIIVVAGLGVYILSNGTRSADSPLVIGTFSKAVDYAPLYVAKHFDWLGEDPKDIAIKEFNDRGVIEAESRTGNIGLVLAALPPIAITRAAGADLSVVEVACSLQQEIVVRSNLSIKSISDLRGQKLAVLKGTSSHYGLLKALGAAGLGPKDVRIQYLPPIEARSKFEASQIDAWAVWPPFVEQQILNGKGNIIVGGGAVIQSVIAITESGRLGQNERAKYALEGIRRAKAWMLQHPEESQAIVAREMNLDLKVVELAWGTHNWGARMDESFQEDVKSKIEFLAEQNLLRSGHEKRLSDLLNTKWGGQMPLGK